MPDLAVEYVLTTPAGVITFNDGSQDQFYIQDIPSGLTGAPISAPIDEVAFGDGSLGYNWWKRGRHIAIDGVFFVQSVPFCSPAQVAVWNEMEEELRVALDSISTLETQTATLVWRPAGQTQRTLVVRNDVPLECLPDQNYQVRTFQFGLFAQDPAWVEST
jgi:hypothetical protein